MNRTNCSSSSISDWMRSMLYPSCLSLSADVLVELGAGVALKKQQQQHLCEERGRQRSFQRDL
jgi:hypothetical protein